MSSAPSRGGASEPSRYISMPTAPTPAAPQEVRELRVGLLDMRPNFEAERAMPEAMRAKIASDLQAALGEINARPKSVIPTMSVMKMLGPREKAMYDTCWVDPACLAKALEPAGLDMALVGKLRMKEVEGVSATSKTELDQFGRKVETKALGEYSLFMRLVDLRQGRTLREFVVTHTDYTRLGELSTLELRKGLVSLGLLVADPRDVAVAAAPKKTGDDLDVASLRELAQSENKRPKVLKAVGYTTLGLGLIATGLGGTFGYLSKKKQDDQKKVANPADYKSLRDDRKRYMTLSNVMFGTGGAFLASSVVLLTLGYLDKDEPQGSGGGVFVTPDGFMIGAHTRF